MSAENQEFFLDQSIACRLILNFCDWKKQKKIRTVQIRVVGNLDNYPRKCLKCGRKM